MPLDVEGGRGHPIVLRHPVQLEVGLAAIDPKIWCRAVELREVVLGGLDVVVVRGRRLRNPARGSWRRHLTCPGDGDRGAVRHEGWTIVDEASDRPMDFEAPWVLWSWRGRGRMRIAFHGLELVMVRGGGRLLLVVVGALLAHLIDVRLRQVHLVAKVREVARDLLVEGEMCLHMLVSGDLAFFEPRQE